MITLRKAVAIAATGALVLVGAASTATAQTAQSTLTVNVKNAGPVPASVSSYAVTTTCRLLAGSLAQQDASSSFPAAGGTFAQVFSLTANSNCSVKVVATGAGAANGVASISIGGSVRASGQLGSTLTLDQTAANATPVTGPTTIDIVITYPSFTVKKVVVGDEPVAGYDYPMAAVCFYGNGVIYGKSLFTLKSGATKTFSVADFSELVAGSTCHVTELGSNGAANVSISTLGSESGATAVASIALPAVSTATNPNPFINAGNFSTLPAVTNLAPLFASSAINPNGAAVTVTNSYVGDLIVSKVVVGDPKSNIAVYEISVSCNNNGPRETFLLKDRQSKVFTGISTGASCLVSESRSDGATASYADNSGDNATDGRVIIKGTASGCIDTRLSAFPDCRANVIVTNTYGAVTTTAAAPAPTTAAAPAAVTTAAPVAPAAPEEPAVLDDTEVTVG
jgi:Domain of unknown function (DUF5979)